MQILLIFVLFLATVQSECAQYVPVCVTISVEQCETVYKEVCHSLMHRRRLKEVCEVVPEQQCSNVPREVCTSQRVNPRRLLDENCTEVEPVARRLRRILKKQQK